MRTAGVREVKDRLSEFLRLVRAGEQVLITDRGEVVAMLGPPGAAFDQGDYPLLEVMIRQGRATRAAPNRADLYAPTNAPGISREDLMRLLDEERADR
jgi:antitoxin (DNA-binding transcriptional repressor) of toxin-antitoxin stability system